MTKEAQRRLILSVVQHSLTWIGLAEIRERTNWGEDYSNGKGALHVRVWELVKSKQLESTGGMDSPGFFRVRIPNVKC